jgi:dTDP-4-amino-4,6-dideoxygalactose transaminase
MIGSNSRLDAIQAAILNVKIKQLDDWIRARQGCPAYYNRELCEIREVKTPSVDATRSHTYHQYTIRAARRDELKKYLEAKKIPTMIYYRTPLHKQPALKNFGHDEKFPVAERVAREVLSLPLYPELKKIEQQKIIKSIKEFYAP